jgi:hypothetical protein
MQDTPNFTQIGNFGFENIPSGKTATDGCSRVARWYIYKPKIPILERLGMEYFGIFHGLLVYSVAFGIFWSHFWCILYRLVATPRKIWQPWVAD